MCALNWLNSYCNKLSKLQKKSPFVMNRLLAIEKMCQRIPIKFGFVAGEENPSDMTTRVVSMKQLKKSCYLTGPAFMSEPNFSMDDNIFSFQVPNPLAKQEMLTVDTVTTTLPRNISKPVVSLDKFSSFSKLIRTTGAVLQAIRKFKSFLKSSGSLDESILMINIDHRH